MPSNMIDVDDCKDNTKCDEWAMRVDEHVRDLEHRINAFHRRCSDIFDDMSVLRSSLDVAHDRIDVVLDRDLICLRLSPLLTLPMENIDPSDTYSSNSGKYIPYAFALQMCSHGSEVSSGDNCYHRCRRNRHRRRRRGYHREKRALLQHLMQEYTQCQEQIYDNQSEINQLKDHIERLCALPGKLSDGLRNMMSALYQLLLFIRILQRTDSIMEQIVVASPNTEIHCQRHHRRRRRCPCCRSCSTYQRRSRNTVFVQSILEQNAQCRDHIFQQHHDIRQLKEYVRKFRDMIEAVNDALDTIAHSTVDIQRHLQNMNNNANCKMTEFLRARKDYIDLRPIPIDGPKNFSYRWKMIALLDFNEHGQYILPFSNRVINIPKVLWPRILKQPPPPGHELCGCIDCEYKTWHDHVLRDDVDDEVSTYGNLHLEVAHRLNFSENNADQSCDCYSDNPMDEQSDDGNPLDDSHVPKWSQLSLSPFPCVDPFDSYDLEC
ncbi:unnamed protein product [Adineta ricciae]|uniref:Uncharacterized protein n=1 Tax=Adineta ricciae TaxID=249248 RepID=A0A815Y8N9_ADIRI|nr:unnamed protein product [Adineta ricciae]CAF1567449.1 unnamed protein product [Adineta ricciae]